MTNSMRCQNSATDAKSASRVIGECTRKHRFIDTPDGEAGLNYLCAGYKKFFTHIAPHMKTMAWLLENDRAPAEIMRGI